MGIPFPSGNTEHLTRSFSIRTFLNVEVVKGPGVAVPNINNAIGGTVNFRTLEPTRENARHWTSVSTALVAAT